MELTRRQLLRRGAEGVLGIGLIGTGLHAVLSLSAPYSNDDVLVTAPWLRERYDATDQVRIVDARPALVYRRGHVPNAVNVWDNDINVWGQIPRQLAPLDRLATTFGQAGLAHDQTIVVHDDGDGQWAPRLFWALEYFGHSDVRILDGGFSNWETAKGPVSTETPSVGLSDFRPRPDDGKRVTAHEVRNRLDNAGIQLVDARPFATFADGHIPGSFSWSPDGLVEANGGLKRAHALRLSAQDAGIALSDRPMTVVYSDTGLAAARAYVALRLLGLTDVGIYDGGWAEWSTLSNAPVERSSSAAVSAEGDHRSTCW